jgi:formate dehydrogenase subunit gamma
MEAERNLEMPVDQRATDKTSIVRFNIGSRIQHLALMISFILLAITGLAEKFYRTGWGTWIINRFGGINDTRFVHHLFAFVFIGVAVYHFAFLFYYLAVQKRPALMLPNLQDARDGIHYLRYCLGLTNIKPEYGRYDYRQKFEYWGILFGGTIMLVSGAVLLWPVFFTSFLPGGVVPAAKEFHSNEALLAVLTIVVWHFYSAHFRPGTFPGDVTIFTGKISRERMKEEHSIEYDEMVRESQGKSDAAPEQPAPDRP